MFEKMSAPAADSLMEVSRLFRADKRPEKIDLGVGTYRDGEGLIKVMTAVKEAEGWHLKSQTGKGYLGPGGDQRFCELMVETLFPHLSASRSGRVTYVQTPGGTGAYRLGLELAAYQSPGSRLIVGTPTWPNHVPVAERTGLGVATYRIYDSVRGELDFEAMLQAASEAQPGDLYLLHGCCHNPTGAPLSDDQWSKLADVLLQQRLLPVIDLAYAGMSKGLVEDCAGARLLLESLPEALVALSCSKSFGLYSERVGILMILASSEAQAQVCRSASEALARSLWSNPPDHGAAIVRTVLGDEAMRAAWLAELGGMRSRLASVRHRLARSGVEGARHLEAQEGLFAILPFDIRQVKALREQHAIYMDLTGRINIAGLNEGNIGRFMEACGRVSLVPCID